MNEQGSLAENEYIKELFTTLKDSGRDTAGLSALLHHVGEMESFVKRAEDKIADMKSQLSEMKEMQDHPLKAALKTAIKNLEQKVSEVKTQLAAIKSNIAEGCRNAVAAFREKGITALDNLASFFHVKNSLQNLRKSVDSVIEADNKAAERIGAFAVEYHSAGRAVKNMARMAAGKEPVQTHKEIGKLAKTIAAPYFAHRAVMTDLRRSVDKAIASIERLDKEVHSQQEKQAERTAEKKPSLLLKLETNKERVEQAKREMPMPERAKVQGVEV